MTNKNLSTVICYKQNTPTVYNAGTEWETSEDTFLAYYYRGTKEQAQAEVDRINTEKPEKLFNGESAKCEERTYFVSEQKEMN